MAKAVEIAEAITVELDGKSYELPTDVPPDEIVTALWQRLQAQRHDPIRLLADQFDQLKDNPVLWAWVQKQAEPAVQEFFKGGRRQPTRQDLMAQLDSPEYLIWSMAWLLRRKYPELTEEQAMRIFFKMQTEELRRLRDAATKQVADVGATLVETGGAAPPVLAGSA